MDDEDGDELQWHYEAEDHLNEVEDDNLDYEKLLRHEIPDLDNEDEEEPQWHYEAEDYLDEVEHDSLDNEDLTFNTSVLDSFSYPKSGANKLTG